MDRLADSFIFSSLPAACYGLVGRQAVVKLTILALDRWGGEKFQSQDIARTSQDCRRTIC